MWCSAGEEKERGSERGKKGILHKKNGKKVDIYIKFLVIGNYFIQYFTKCGYIMILTTDVTQILLITFISVIMM